jgi:hypothetical protein
LVDSNSGKCLSAVILLYYRWTLLEILIRYLQARAFLYFNIYKK